MVNNENMTKEEVVSGLQELIFYLGICCYSPDKEQQKKVERMGWCVQNAIRMLEN